MGRGRRHRSISEDSRYSDDYDNESYSEEEPESRSRTRSRSRHHRRRHRHRGHGGHRSHRRRHRDRERDRDRDRHRHRGGGGGHDRRRDGAASPGKAGTGADGTSGGSGDWRRDLKDFIRKNRLDERTQAALRGLDKNTAKEVMGIDGGTNSFILEGVRNPDAVVMSRIRRCGERR